MKEFLKITKSKTVLFFGIVAIILVSTVVLFMINERDIAGVLLYPLTAFPITIFNLITGSAFAPKECFVLCFPTLPQVVFMLLFDVALIYIITCVIASLRKKEAGTQTQNSGF